MSASTLEQLGYSLRRYYSTKRIIDVGTRATVLWKDLNKAVGYGGEDGKYYWPLMSGNAPGVGGGFSAAQSNAGVSKGDQFAAPEQSDYGVLQLRRNVLLGTHVGTMAWQNARQQEAASVLRSVGQMLAIHLYGTGTGVLGRRSGALAGNTITLYNPDDAKKFFRGMVIQASSAASAVGGLRTGTAIVTGRNLTAGTVTVDNAAGITGFVAYAYLAYNGDFANPGPMGMMGWFPPTAETSGTFFGVARAGFPDLLQGQRFVGTDATSSPRSECIRKLSADIQFAHGQASKAYVHTRQWEALATEAGSRVYREQGGNAEFGFKRIFVKGAGGDIEVLPDPYCPLEYGFVVDPTTLEYRYAGNSDDAAPVQLVTEDLDGGFMRMASEDGFEFRWATYGNLICYAPAWNGIFQMTAV